MKKVKALRNELSEIENRLFQTGVELEQAQQRLDATKKKEAQAESYVLKLRSERQDLLVDGGSLEEINALIDTARKFEELLGDEIEGLSRKITRLGDEDKRLSVRKTELQKDIFREDEIRPLVVKYNELAPQLAGILMQLDAAAWRYRKTFSTAGQRLVQSGPDVDYHLVHAVPGIWLYGEEPVPAYYDRKLSVDKYELMAVDETMRAKYPDCNCFKCTGFVKVNKDFTCSCSRLQGIIPRTVLTGQATQENTPVLNRCKFELRA